MSVLPWGGRMRAAVPAWIEARRWRRIAVAVGSGLLLSRCFSPLGLWPFLFVSLPLAVLLIDGAGNRRAAFARGWLFGFGFFIGGLNWIAISFTQQTSVPAALGPPAVLALSACMAVYMGLCFMTARMVWTRSPWRVLVFAAVWTLFEGLRGVLFTGFPWNVVGAVWADFLWPAQGAWVVSVYGLSLLTVFAGASAALLITPRLTWSAVSPAAVAVMMLTALAAWGGARLQQTPVSLRSDLNLKLVQANVKQYEKWIPERIEDHFDNHLGLSRSGGAGGRARGVDLLIWPEASVQRSNFDREGSIHRWRLSRLLEPGARALVGGPRYELGASGTSDDYQLYNSFFVVTSEGQIEARYDKRHLVPFGEFLPFRPVLKALGIEQLTGGPGFTAGTSSAPIRLSGIPPFRVLICYEAIFPGAVRDAGGAAEWMLNITNDGWFGISEGPFQHLALAKMRAIEEGLPLVRSAGGGVSAIIEPLGRTISSLGLDRRGAVNGRLPNAIPNHHEYNTTFNRIIAVFAFCLIVISTTIISRKRNLEGS